MCTNPPRRQRGMTLIELIVFIVVVSVGLAGVLSVLNITAFRSADPILAKQALAAADAMMEEILLKDFTDPGGPVETGRASWDDVDDYNGYASTGVFAPNDLGTPIIAGLTVAVRVETPTADLHSVPMARIRGVTVTIGYGTESLSLTGYRINYDLP